MMSTENALARLIRGEAGVASEPEVLVLKAAREGQLLTKRQVRETFGTLLIQITNALEGGEGILELLTVALGLETKDSDSISVASDGGKVDGS